MEINVAQQLKGDVGDVRIYPIEGVMKEGFAVTGEAKLVRTPRSILVTGQFKCEVPCTCCLCLEEYNQPLDFEIEEEYVSSERILEGSDGLLEADGFSIGACHILDLSEALRQGISLRLSSRLVCRLECAGLCHTCGFNLNLGPCKCSN